MRRCRSGSQIRHTGHCAAHSLREAFSPPAEAYRTPGCPTLTVQQRRLNILAYFPRESVRSFCYALVSSGALGVHVWQGKHDSRFADGLCILEIYCTEQATCLLVTFMSGVTSPDTCDAGRPAALENTSMADSSVKRIVHVVHHTMHEPLPLHLTNSYSGKHCMLPQE